MTFSWRADGGLTLNAGLVEFVVLQVVWTSIARKPYIFVIFRPPVSFSGSAHAF